MDDAERLAALVLRLVRRVQPVQDARHDRARRSRRGMRCAASRDARMQARERLARHVLHDEEELAVRRDDVERRDDVRMPDARREARLVEEHRDELGILRELRVQPLDRDRAREADRPEQPPEMDRRHAARRDLVEAARNGRPVRTCRQHSSRVYQRLGARVAHGRLEPWPAARNGEDDVVHQGPPTEPRHAGHDDHDCVRARRARGSGRRRTLRARRHRTGAPPRRPEPRVRSSTVRSAGFAAACGVASLGTARGPAHRSRVDERHVRRRRAHRGRLLARRRSGAHGRDHDAPRAARAAERPDPDGGSLRAHHRRERRHATPLSAVRAACCVRRRRSSSRARPARARSCSPSRSRRRAARGQAVHGPRLHDIGAEHDRAELFGQESDAEHWRRRRGRESSSSRTAARSSSTRSATSISRSSPGSCGRSSDREVRRSAAIAGFPSTCASSRRRGATSTREIQAGRFRDDLFLRLAVRASSFRRCARAKETSRCSRSTSGRSSAAVPARYRSRCCSAARPPLAGQCA